MQPVSKEEKTPRAGALEGLRVLELGHIVAGPFAGMILAALGAEVIKIEPPGSGDSMRRPTSIGLFYSINWNKKSVQLDLHREKDRNVFFELVRESDIIIENMGPGIVEKLGVGYSDVSRINPALIYCSIKGFLPGPYGHRPFVDEMAQMMGGLAYMTGLRGKPMRAGASLADMGAATFAVVGILAALFRRQETGQGDYIVAGMFETVSLWMARYLVEYQLSGEVPEPITVKGMGNRMRWEVYDSFKTKEGKDVIIACTSDKHWERFCRALALTEWQKDPRLTTKDGRLAAREWLIPQIQQAVIGYPREEIMELLDSNGVPVAAVNTPADLADDRHLQAIRQLLTVTSGDRTVRTPLLPLRSYRHGSPATGRIPDLGENTEEFVRKYSKKE